MLAFCERNIASLKRGDSTARYFAAIENIDEALIEDSDDHALARDIIEVHGTEAAIVARANARSAAVAGQAVQAESSIRVLGIIQRRQAGQNAGRAGS